MSILPTLKFVRGAVSSKDLIPVLTHFCIRDGRVQGQNGRVVVDAPCAELQHITTVVPADKFLRAVDHCGDPVIKVTDDTMALRKGRFSASMKTMKMEDYPDVDQFEMEHVVKDPDVLASVVRSFNLLAEFVSRDASRPWSCSILLRGKYAFATNNAVLARTSIYWKGPDLAIPDFAVDEFTRINQIPVSLSWCKNAARFVYADGSWLQTRLLDGAWPVLDTLMSVLDSNQPFQEVTTEVREGLESLKPFFPDVKLPIVICSEEGFSTQAGTSEAAVAFEGLPKAAFHFVSLTQVMLRAYKWNPHQYPGPVPWFGDQISGVLSGIRL